MPAQGCFAQLTIRVSAPSRVCGRGGRRIVGGVALPTPRAKGATMAASKTKTKLPTLVHPDGREYTPSTAQEANNLVQAEGYSVKGKTELPDAFTEGLSKLADRRKTEAGKAKAAPASTSGEAADTGTSRSGTDTANAPASGAAPTS